MQGTPPHLRRIQRKHLALRGIWKAQLRFEATHQEEDVPDHMVCTICKEKGTVAVVPILHASTATKCECFVHEECLQRWQAAHERKGKRTRICPACRTKRAGCWQPAPRKPALCGSLVGGRMCRLPLGHLGHCRKRLSISASR